MRAAAPFVALALLAAAPALATVQELPAPQPASPPQETPPPPDPKAILEGVCTSCHGLDFIAERRKTRDDWDFTVRRMIDKGADLDPDTAALVVDYLAKTYPAEPPKAEEKPS